MIKLITLLTEMEGKLSNSETVHSAVSKSSVGWHIAHALMTINQIIGALENSKPQNYKWRFNLTRMYIYCINKIPRGQGKAPASVVPKGEITANILIKSFRVTMSSVTRLSALHSDNYFEHPYFGKLNLKPAIRFLEIHTRHHLRIINDIIKANKALT